MQNTELMRWTKLTDKPLAGHLDVLETHGLIQGSFAGWTLTTQTQQLDFLQELYITLTIGESENLRLAELSTGQPALLDVSATESENLRLHVDNPDILGDGQNLGGQPDANLNGFGIEPGKDSEIISESEQKLSTAPTTTTTEENNKYKYKNDSVVVLEKQIAEIEAEEARTIRAEIVKMCIGDNEAYNKFIDDPQYMPQFILGHYLQLMASDEHSNKSLLVSNILTRPVHPQFYHTACKMIVNGDY